MNAEDLVITFKRDIASLSRTEHRRLRLRSRTLPALRVRRGREEGQIEERRAALPLPGLRQDLRHGQRAHPGDEQAPKGDLDGLRRVLRAHAAPARVREALPRLPQDRLHHAPQADRVPLGLLPLVQGRAGLRLRARRDLFPQVVQGQPREGDFRDAAPPRHRGRQVHRRGLSRERICVMTGVNDSNETFLEVTGRGALSRGHAMDALRGRIAAGSVVATDRAAAYVGVLAELEVAAHEAYDPKDRSGGTINRVNAVRSLLGAFMGPFKGVSTKHLDAYLAWFRWCRTFMATDSGAAGRTVARQLAHGTCRSRVRDMFNVEPPYMDYWAAPAA